METLFKSAKTDIGGGGAHPVTTPEIRAWDVSERVREHFRKVRSALDLSNRDSLCAAVCCTSPGEGASWVASKLSCAVAEEGASVVLVDGNLCHPSQAAIFGIDNSPEVAVQGAEALNLAVRRTGCLDISIFTPQPGGPTGQRFSFLLRDSLPNLRTQAKVILIDCEPMRDSSELLDLAPAIDGVVFVLEAERERREVVARSIASIKRAGLKFFGVVLNKRKRYIPGWLYRAL